MHTISSGASFENLHPRHTYEKYERDIEALERYARFVITIEDNGTIRITSNYRRIIEVSHIVPLIAVVAPVLGAGRMFRASVLEIAYRRSRPYSRVESPNGRLLLQRRDASFALTKEQFALVYSVLLSCLEKVLTETRARWKSDDARFVNGTCYERGVQITVRTSDDMLAGALLRESAHYFRLVFLKSNWVFWLNERLKYTTMYAGNPTGYGPQVRKAASSVALSTMSKRPFWRETMLRLVKKRNLLENALLYLHGIHHVWDAETHLAYGGDDLELPAADGILFWHTPDQPTDEKGRHAQGCIRFEVLFDRRNPKHKGERAHGFFKPVQPEEYYDDPEFIPF